MPRELKEAGDGVAVGAVSAVADRQRARRVGGHQLHLDAFLGRGRSRTVVGAGVEDLAQGFAEPRGFQPEVEESRPRHLRPLDCRETGDPSGELLGELTRWPAGRGGGAQRDVGRVVAVLVLGRPLQRDGRAGELAQLVLEPANRVGRCLLHRRKYPALG